MGQGPSGMGGRPPGAGQPPKGEDKKDGKDSKDKKKPAGPPRPAVGAGRKKKKKGPEGSAKLPEGKLLFCISWSN